MAAAIDILGRDFPMSMHLAIGKVNIFVTRVRALGTSANAGVALQEKAYELHRALSQTNWGVLR